MPRSRINKDPLRGGLKRTRRQPAPEGLIVLGIDPGTLVTGYGLITRTANDVFLLDCGTIRNAAGDSMARRLKKIYTELLAVIQQYHPHECAIESAFYGKNAQSALKLGHARGVALLAAVLHGIPTAEYSPREVKKAVVGTGAASKEQVQFMVKSLLRTPQSRMLLDTSDAIAIALCHVQRIFSPGRRQPSWESFIAAHPDLVSA